MYSECALLSHGYTHISITTYLSHRCNDDDDFVGAVTAETLTYGPREYTDVCYR